MTLDVTVETNEDIGDPRRNSGDSTKTLVSPLSCSEDAGDPRCNSGDSTKTLVSTLRSFVPSLARVF